MKIPHIGLLNVVAGREVAPEFVQDAFTTLAVADALDPLFVVGNPMRERMVQDMAEVRQDSGEPGAAARVAGDGERSCRRRWRDRMPATRGRQPPAQAASAVARKVRWLLPIGLLGGLLGRTWRFRVRHEANWPTGGGAPAHGGVRALARRACCRPSGSSATRGDHGAGQRASRRRRSIARILAAWDRTVRGSTTRGGSRALLAMIKELERGVVVAVTPDGPQGPARWTQPGHMVAAQRERAGRCRSSMHADRAWRLKSWDRFTIPKFFARVTIRVRRSDDGRWLVAARSGGRRRALRSHHARAQKVADA